MKVVIIGGVAGGASAAARLRRLDEKAEIIILEKGEYISYANCGLPYYIGGVITEKEALTLQTPRSFYQRFRIDVRTGSEAVKIDRNRKMVTVRESGGGLYEESYDKLILSPGAKPVLPPFSAVEDERVFTLRNIPDTYRITEFIEREAPHNALIVGGGYIGTELAENLFRRGLKVSVAELSDHLIAPLDFDMACDVHRYLRSKGIQLFLNTVVEDIRKVGKQLEVQFDCGTEAYDMVVLSVGVKPDTEFLKDTGLNRNQKGALTVNASMQTSDGDIYAVGDAVTVKNFVSGTEAYIPLAGPANKQGRIAADHICGIESAFGGTQGSSVLKLFDMTIAATGLNETSARMAGIDYDKVYAFSPSHAAYYPEPQNMCIKLLFEKKDGKILGAQIVGFDGVDKRCDVIAAAIRGRMKVEELTELELCYAPPFSSAKDPVNMAGFIAENVRKGLVKQFFVSDVPKLPENAVKLDVRTNQEYRRGHIDGTLHVPLDELRERIDEIPRGNPIYVNCQSGLRSYIACRILSQNGFDCYNLAGGYRLFASVADEGAFDTTPRHACGIAVGQTKE